MVHSTIRILAALLLAVWMPLCCCQTAMLFGSACEAEIELEERGDDGNGCCSRSHVEEESCDEIPAHPAKPCKCFELGKRAVESERESASKTVRFEQNEVLIPIAVLASMQSEFSVSASLFESLSTRDFAAPPFIKANRALLRWHCALIV